MDKLQAAEKPLTFVFTYLERHWIDRQINEPRIDILPVKQLIWSMWDDLVLQKIWPSGAINQEIGVNLNCVRNHQIPLEEVESVAKFVHYLRVISKPTHLESDYKATRRVMMAGAVINARAQHPDRFKEFVQWYCGTIEQDCPKLTSIEHIHEFIQAALQFWNEEEGRMAFFRFDKAAQVTVRNHLKSLLLLPNLEALRVTFKQSILNWNILDANAIYRLLANRKSLLAQLDSEAEISFHQKGAELIKSELASLESLEEVERSFINVLGQFYSATTDLIQTSFASRPEIFESRSRAFRALFNDPPLPSNLSKIIDKKLAFSAKSLAKFADYLIRNTTNVSITADLSLLVALFRLIDNKDEFQETFAKLLSLRLLSMRASKPSAFERNLFNELKIVCGAFYIKPFERMYGDIAAEPNSTGLTVITGGTWNLNTKILPGNPVLLNPTDNFNWPAALSSGISKLSHLYHERYPKRKLYFSPLLTSIEFEYSYKGKRIDLKASALHLSILQELSAGGIEISEIIRKYGQLSVVVLRTLEMAGLISKIGESLELCALSSTDPCDLYTLALNELVFGCQTSKSTSTNYSSSSNRSTPHPSTTFAKQDISPIDKSILLQCSITRIMKQLRSVNLPDLFSRISMLPKLLTRFSPTLEDVLDALKQLHEKEFVMLATGDGIDEVTEIGEGDLSNKDRASIWIKYLA